MIVKCEKCQTRFKIPDEKVTPKGVKVRCTKCQNTFRVTRGDDAPAAAAPPPPPPPAPRVDTDPFARFGIGEGPSNLEATRPGFFAAGVDASRLPEPLQPSFSAQRDLPSEVFDSPTRVAPIPAGLRGDVPAPLPPPVSAPPAFDPSNPFDAPPRPPTDFELTSPQAPVFDPAALPPPPPPAAPTAPPVPDAASLKAVSSAPLDDFGASSDDVAHAPGLLGELPPPDDLFGSSAPETPQAPDRRLFDMPSAPPPALDDVEDMTATATLPRPAAATALAQPGPQVEKPHGRPEDVGMAEGRRGGGFGRGLGLVVNLAVGSLLVVGLLTVGTIYLNEGKVDPSSLSLEPLKGLFRAPSELLPVDVSNGLYDTRAGRPVFYVRGEVENRGAAPARVQVNVEILDGALSLTRASVLAGAAPTPEELFAVTSAQDVGALAAKLDKAAVEIPAKGRAPFLVAFYEYPPELAQYRLKVTVERAAEATKTAEK